MYKIQIFRLFKIFTLIIMLVFPFLATAQVTMPDTAFLRFIKNKYPKTIDANNNLVISEAAKVTTIYCNFPNVVDIEGIQYFKNLQILHVYKGKLKHIPNIDSLVLLRQLSVYENQLDSLPSLANLPRLSSLICYSNNLKKFPNFHPNSVLDTLLAGINLFEDASPISNLIHLTNLGIWNCKLKKMPDLSNIINLKVMSIGTNHFLDSVSDLSKFANLSYLDLDNNNFSAIPNLQSNILLKSVKLNNNPLTFQNILPYINHPNFENFIYYPQDTVGVNLSFSFNEGDPFQYNLGIDASITSNVYKIYKNNKLIDSNNTGIISIPYLSISDSGN